MKLKKLEILIVLFFAVFINRKASSASEIQTQETDEQRKLVNILFNVPFLTYGSGARSMFGGSADFSISEDWTLGPKFQTTSQWWAVGIDSKYNLAHSNFTSGWFINPSIDYMRNDSNYSQISRLEVTTRFGYGWFFKNGFNINASAGPVVFTQIEAKITQPNVIYSNSSGEPTTHGIGLIGHFSLGYSF